MLSRICQNEVKKIRSYSLQTSVHCKKISQKWHNLEFLLGFLFHLCFGTQEDYNDIMGVCREKIRKAKDHLKTKMANKSYSKKGLTQIFEGNMFREHNWEKCLLLFSSKFFVPSKWKERKYWFQQSLLIPSKPVDGILHIQY